MLGMTRGEMGLVLFVFLLVWSAGIVPRIGERLALWLGEKKKGAGGS
jgi:Sec-independent protein translocase protein TatA